MKRYRVIFRSGASCFIFAKGIARNGKAFTGRVTDRGMLNFDFIEPLTEFGYVAEQVDAVVAEPELTP